MATQVAIVINLDHGRFPVESCRLAWGLIESCMRREGFARAGRVFVSDSNDYERAVAVGNRLLPALDRALATYGLSGFDMLSEFYILELTRWHDMLRPQAGQITLAEEDSAQP